MEENILCKWKSKRKSEYPSSYQKKTGLKIKSITRDKEGRYIMIKGSIQEEDITTVIVYAHNIGAPRCIR